MQVCSANTFISTVIHLKRIFDAFVLNDSSHPKIRARKFLASLSTVCKSVISRASSPHFSGKASSFFVTVLKVARRWLAEAIYLRIFPSRLLNRFRNLQFSAITARQFKECFFLTVTKWAIALSSKATFNSSSWIFFLFPIGASQKMQNFLELPPFALSASPSLFLYPKYSCVSQRSLMSLDFASTCVVEKISASFYSVVYSDFKLHILPVTTPSPVFQNIYQGFGWVAIRCRIWKEFFWKNLPCLPWIEKQL